VSDPVEVRCASVADLDLLVELRLEYIRADLAELTGPQEAAIAAQLRMWIPASLSVRFFAVLALVDQMPASVAMLAVNEYPANPRFPNGRVGTVLNVWTRPAHRRRGLATALLREVIELGGRLGLSKLELLSSEAGQALYAGLGFVPSADDHLPMELCYYC
jgi:ribosomal protein S18 acetylase RimI-like enzyme